jgi:hypothetical protein
VGGRSDNLVVEAVDCYTKKPRGTMNTTKEKDQFDPFILGRAADWEDIVENNALLTDAALVMVDPSATKKDTIGEVASSLTPAAIGTLTALWFEEAVNGCHIRFPLTEQQLDCYKLFESYLWTSFMLVLSLIELFGAFVEVPGCDYHGDIVVGAAVKQFASSSTITAVNMVCVTVQMADVFLWYRSSPSHFIRDDKTRLVADHTYRWMIIRGICCAVCFIDFLAYFIADGNSPRFSRCLFPVILISRQENTRLIIEGFLIVIERTLFVIALLIGILNFYSLMGLFLFRNMARELGIQTFDSYRIAFTTCLHCFASRPTVLFTLSPYVVASNAAPYFFVSMTMVADLLIGTLLVAIANR